ncbi:MAG TPA: hypothetical protein DEB39_04315, partial [Planctomycetaceae bacterium]|nr:hypothetical protein [Planctomycetaceae bacterium]
VSAKTSADAAANAAAHVPDRSPKAFVPKTVSLAQAEQTLVRLLAERLKPTEKKGGYLYVHPRETGRTARIVFDAAHPVTQSAAQSSAPVDIQGDREIAAQLVTLLREIDRPEPPKGRARRFITVRNTDAEMIGRIFEANIARKTEAQRTESRKTEPLKTDPLKTGGPTTNEPGIRPVAFTMQDGDFRDGAFRDGTFRDGPLFDPDAERSGGMEVVPDFQFQVIPDLDVIVIDATGAEVARFEDMIRRIEELSKIAEPKIEIYYLKHVDCVSLRWVIASVLAPVFRTKQGAVEIVPLVNPNAILLIGWGKAFDTMKDLFETLDRPVAEANNTLKTIKLKHAPASQVLQTIRQTFPPVAAMGSGFAPRVNVLVDQRSNTLIVQAGPNDFAEINRIVKELDVSHAGPSVQVRTFKLKNTLATDLAQVLLDAIAPGLQGTSGGKLPMLEMLVADEHGRRMIRSGIMSDVRVSRDVRNNTIIVTAPEHCMELMEHLVEMLDVPNATAEIKVYRILYGDAESMVRTLQSLIPTQLAGQVGPMLPAAKEEDTLVPVRFAIDRRTNSIIAAGAIGDLEIIEGLLLSLDREEEQARKVSVYQLKSSQAARLAEAVNEYLKAKRIIQQESTGAISAYEQLESEVVVIPEPIQNSLIVSATPRYYDEIIQVIEELDRQPAQVVIQVLIAEVALGNTKELGAEFGIQDSLLFDRNTFSNIENATTKTTTTNADGTVTVVETIPANAAGNPGFAWGNPSNSLGNSLSGAALAGAGTVGSQLLTNFATGRTNAEAGFGGIVFSASSDAVSIMLRAMQESRRLEILSRPQIMALDNQAAFIHAGQDVPRAGDTEITNSGNTRSSVTNAKIGLLLMVTPRISADNRVVLDVVAVKSSLDGSDDGVTIGYAGNLPLKSQKINVMQTMTMVSAADNETVMLGGLITKEIQCINRKVPLLGDIPLLGKLFQYNFDRTRRTELLVVLTPRIVRGNSEAQRIKQVEAARMSWCLSNVTDLHGDAAIYDLSGDVPVDGGLPVFYPETVSEDDLLPLEQQPVLTIPQRRGPTLYETPNPATRPTNTLPKNTLPTPTLAPTVPKGNM